MAEQSPSPSLPSTADATPYVPVSWPAAAAVTVAVIFALTLLVLGGMSFRDRKPLLEQNLVILPIIALVLCFAARKTIRNSEGTQTGILYGINLVNTAWWLSVILGLCFVAYLFAIDYAIRRDARGEVDKWFGYMSNGEKEGTYRAFYYTLPPGARQGIAADDLPAMDRRFRDELLIFRNCDLAQLAQRNKGSLNLDPNSVTWTYKAGTIDCFVTGKVECPEGSFPIVVQLRGSEGIATSEGGGSRQWTIERPAGGGFIDETRVRRTPYGWLIATLADRGGTFGKNFIGRVMPGPSTHPYAYRAFVAENSRGDQSEWFDLMSDPVLQLAFAVPTGMTGNAGYADYMANHFYKLPGGAEPSPEQKARFLRSFNDHGIRPAGDKLKAPDGSPIDKEILISVTDSAVEVRLPIEIPIPNISGKNELARGRVVVACTDPAVLARLNQLKSEADPKQGTPNIPEDLARKSFPWRVVRIESEMIPINVSQPRGAPGGPPGMPGMPGG